MTGQTDVEIPETGAIFTFGRTSFADNVPSKFWLKNDHPKHMSCGGEHSAVITENGRLLMFGGNTWGQLGLRFKPSARKPISVKALKSEKVKLAACGRDHTIVCTFHGSVYSAGSNQDGQLGLGHCDKSAYFHLLRPFCDWAPIKMLSAGCNTSAALTEDGRLFMWGDNSVGQIAFGDEGFAAEPREVHVGEAVIWVSCGYKHSAFVTVYGRLYTFGESANGRLGLQEEQLANHRVPQQVQGVLGHVTRVCCGGEHTVVLTEKNVYTFGRGQYGQLGHGTFLFEVHLPKALQHFCNSKVRHIACGENHTAVVTDSGLLYTFGDGRHGKLGLGEENFINQFSPTLCTRFLQYAVQSVSCGGHHMLVLATPRPAESQEVVPEKDVLITDYFLESVFTKNIFKNKFINPTPPSPLSALSARARHRDRVRSVELFGDKFQSLPRLNSDFLNTSRQTSRNSLTLKTLSKDATTPSSSPKPKSEVTGSPLLSPRSRSISPQSPLLSSKASSPHSQSSFTLQSKASTSASSKSKCKKVPSPLLLPKSITKLNPSSPVATKMTAKPRLNRAAATKKPLSNKFSSPVPPKEPYTPTRPPSNVFIKNLKEEEHPAPTQTENVKRQIITEEVEEKEDFSPYMGKKKGRAFRHAVKEAEPFAQQIQTNEKTDRNSHKVLPTELMKGPSTLKTEVSPLKSTKKNHKVTSNSKENITKESSNIKPSENRQAQKQLPHFKSPHSTKTQQTLTDAQERVTEVKHKTRKTEDLRESNKPNEEDNSSLKKGLTRTPKKETKKSSSLDPKSPSIKVSKVNQAASLASTENAVKENEATQRRSDDVKPVEVASRRTRRVKSTLTKDQHKVKSVPGVDAKLPAAQEENTTPFKAETKKSVSRKTPLQVKGKLQELKPTAVKDQSKCAENPLIEGESKEKCEENELKCAKDTTLKMKGGTVDEQKLSKIKDKKTAKESGAEQRAKTKRRGGGKEEEIRVKGEGDVDSENKMKAKPKSEASSLLSSQQDTPTEVRGNPISPQSPEVDSLRAAKPLQGAEPVVMDSRVSETDEEDTRGKNGGKTNWGEILSNSASLLPVAGIAGAAIEVLCEAVTSVQSDSDKATSTPSKTLSKVRQFTKQSAVTEPSLCSTLSHFSSSNETEDGLKTDAQAGVPSESVNESQEGENDDSSRDPSEGEAVKGGLSEQIRGEHMEDSQKEVEEKSDKASGEDEDSEDGGKNEDEDVESGSDSEDKREECESSSEKETGEESNTGEGEEDNVSEEEEGEEKTSRSDEDEGSDKTNAAETEGEKESSKKTSDGLSDSDVSEGAEEEEEEGENEESSDEGSIEDKEEESKSEDEEKKSGDESESDECTNRESEEEEEDGEEGDTAESAKTEEEENDEDEEGETEEQNDASTENEDEEKDSVEDEEADKSEGEQDSDKGEEEEDSEADEEELQDDKSDEEEEGGEEREESESVGDGEAETEDGEDEDKEESEEEEESAEEEEKEEDAGDEDTEAEEEEEEKEEDTGDEDIEAEEEEEEKEEDTGDEDTEAEEEEEEKEEDTGDEDIEAEEEKEEDSGDEETEAEEEEEEKEEDTGDEETEAEEEEEEKEEDTGDEETEAEEEKEDTGDEEEEAEEENEKQTRLRGQRKDMKGNDEETDDEDEDSEEEGDEEERDEENKEKGNEKQEEEEEAEEEGIEEEEEGDENEEEEGENEEEEEEDQAKSAKKKKEKRQKPPPDRSSKQKEAPKPAPRTRQRAAGGAKAEDSQQFWNDVLPQYLDLQ
ncbi:X-linked retinitis pigmentosa GTPase regulator [Pelmatolapia mariae]|uniref:X-linked retinitis pigmentosa GTPase regulator n=1 Tax=Pelmatolapia mariae TaxID=158779 RepID=UPI002FE5D007